MTKLALEKISQAEARRVALTAQGFGKKKAVEVPSWRHVRPVIGRMGLLQIDSVNVLLRSHYMPAYSRVGGYDRAMLDEKAFHPQRRRLFEYWAHEASLLPFEMQPLLRWRMAQAECGEGIYKGYVEFARDRGDFVEAALRQIESEGPRTARELNNSGGRRGPWWGRSDGKIALEYLFWCGRVTTATRRGFERVYDLTERVMPAEIMARPTPSERDAQRALMLAAAKSHGIASEADLRDYYRLSTKAARACLKDLVESGDLVECEVEGWRKPGFLHKDTRPRRISGRALLTPFDPLIWERSRAERLFGFRYRIEIYTPAAKRQFGYYVLPFLLDESLVARVDLKADRQNSTLQVFASHGETNTDKGHVAEQLCEELQNLTQWLGLDRMKIHKRGDLARPLAQAGA
ncbi:MAG: winged helix-turn-helix domain-containing protein [Alphaproteobacteria bacterium]